MSKSLRSSACALRWSEVISLFLLSNAMRPTPRTRPSSAKREAVDGRDDEPAMAYIDGNLGGGEGVLDPLDSPSSTDMRVGGGDNVDARERGDDAGGEGDRYLCRGGSFNVSSPLVSRGYNELDLEPSEDEGREDDEVPDVSLAGGPRTGPFEFHLGSTGSGGFRDAFPRALCRGTIVLSVLLWKSGAASVTEGGGPRCLT